MPTELCKLPCPPRAEAHKFCAGGRRYILHLFRNDNSGDSHAYCQSKHGPWSKLAQVDTTDQWKGVLGFLKQVGRAAGLHAIPAAITDLVA